jgi:hypothetical protein
MYFKVSALSVVVPLVLGVGASAVQAGNTNLDIEVRERYEHQENFNDKFYGTNPTKGSASDDYLLSRIRIGITHKFNDRLTGKISLQDARAFGMDLKGADWNNSEFGNIQDNPQHDPMELGETWLQFKATDELTLKAGRQAIFYGNNRVFGPGEWKNSGKWVWDAGKVSWKQGEHFVDGFVGATKVHDPDEFSLGHRHGYDGAGLYGHYAIGKHAAIEPIWAYKTNDESLDYREKTQNYFGLRAYHNALGGMGFVDATYIKAVGDVTKNNGTKADVDAYGYNLDAGVNLMQKKLKLGFTVSHASGDDPATPDSERFDGVFGASDKYYGYMNQMVWSNLDDYGLFANYKPKPGVMLELEYHKFHADQIKDKWKAYSNLNASSDHYGDEIDLIATWKINKQWGTKAGYSYFMPGDLIKQASITQANLTDDTSWSAFFQVNYKFTHGL